MTKTQFFKTGAEYFTTLRGLIDLTLIAIIAIVTVQVVSVGFVIYDQIQEKVAFNDACQILGGSPLTANDGKRVCVDSKAFLTIK